MRRTTLFLVSLALLVPFVVFSQSESTDNGMTCEDYTSKLEHELTGLYLRLDGFPRTLSTQYSNFIAWQEDRIAWQDIEPPECAQSFHNDVIAMYANLGDIAFYTLYREAEPDMRSARRLSLEAVDRTRISVEEVANEVSAVTGTEIDLTEFEDAMDYVTLRLEEPD